MPSLKAPGFIKVGVLAQFDLTILSTKKSQKSDRHMKNAYKSRYPICEQVVFFPETFGSTKKTCEEKSPRPEFFRFATCVVGKSPFPPFGSRQPGRGRWRLHGRLGGGKFRAAGLAGEEQHAGVSGDTTSGKKVEKGLICWGLDTHNEG